MGIADGHRRSAAAGPERRSSRTARRTCAGSHPAGASQEAAAAATLVTGDRVLLPHRDDLGAFTFVPAAGRRAHGYLSAQVAGQLFVLPSDLAPLVPRVLDRSLFDISTLLKEKAEDASRPDVPIVVYLTQRIYEPGPVSMFALPDAGSLEDVLASRRLDGMQ